MAEPSQKIPPQDIEVEQSLLGALVIDKNAILKVTDILRQEDFYKDANRIIYESMLELFEAHEPIDILSLTSRLKEKNLLEKIGGRSYLVSLANQVPTASHVAHYASVIQKKATLRRLIETASDIHELGYNENADIDELLDNAEQKLFRVSQRYLRQVFTPIKTVLEDAFERIDELHQGRGKLRGLPTGFRDLDNILAGLQKSDLVILAARPSVGKTSFALDIARNIAVQTKTPVGIFSLEMGREILVDRLLCAQANVNLWNMRTGRLSDKGDNDDFSRIGHAMGILSEVPIYIDDSSTANVMEIRTKARRLQSEYGLGLLIVDYLQLMDGRRHSESRVQEVAEITRSLKAIARELNIPVLALSQLSRATEMRSPAIPKLADLRESGSIEQDADVVMFIYRKAADKTMRECPASERHIAEIHIDKHRNGPTGMVRLFFDETITSFRNLEEKVEAPIFPQEVTVLS